MTDLNSLIRNYLLIALRSGPDAVVLYADMLPSGNQLADTCNSSSLSRLNLLWSHMAVTVIFKKRNIRGAMTAGLSRPQPSRT